MITTPEPTIEPDVLQMIRAEVNVRELYRWMGVRRLADQDHAMHCLLTECFGDLAPRPFRLIVPRGGSTGVLYGYGRSGTDALREASAICADPLQCRVIPAEKLDSKEMPTQWRVGKLLGFETRVRPIVRRSRRSENRPSGECDAFLWEALQQPVGGMKRSREEVYAGWLSDQFNRIGGARLDIEHIKLVSFQRSRAIRRLRARHTEGPDALMRGILTIIDPAGFRRLLARGVGRHRAYGFGMLLLRPGSG